MAVWELSTSRLTEIAALIVESGCHALKKSDTALGSVRVYSQNLIGVQGIQRDELIRAQSMMDAGEGDALWQATYPDAVAMLNLGIDFELPPVTGDNSKEVCDLSTANCLEAASVEPDSASRFIDKVEVFLKAVQSACPNFRLSNKIKLVEKEIQMANTSGLKRAWRDSWVEAEVLFTPNTSEAIYSGVFETRNHAFEPERWSKTLIRLIQAYENPVDLPSRRLPVIFFDDEYAWMQYFMQSLSSRAWRSDSSKRTELSPHFSVAMSRQKESFLEPFDACGTVLKGGTCRLIDGGKWVRPYSDRLSSYRYGFEDTAATWAAYDGVPGFGYMPLRLEDDRKLKFKELIPEQAVLVLTTGGGEFSQDGSFAAPAQLAYLMEGGEIVGRLPQVMVTGEVSAMFGKDYIGCSANEVLDGINRRGMIAWMNLQPL